MTKDNPNNNSGIRGNFTDQMPRIIFIVPLRQSPLFPGMLSTVEITDEQDIETLKKCENLSGIGFLMVKDENKAADLLRPEDFYTVGTFARIRNSISTIFGTKSIYVDALCKFKVINIICLKGQITAEVEYIEEEKFANVEGRALLEALQTCINERNDSNFITENIRFNSSNIHDAIRLADYLASILVPPEKQQEYMEIMSGKQRILSILSLLKEEYAIQKIHNDIQGAVSKRVNDQQKEYYLREQLKAVKEELAKLSGNSHIQDLSDGDVVAAASGIKNVKQKTLGEKITELNLTGEARDTVFEEYARFESMEQINPEYSSLRTYLETVADLPWNTRSTDNTDIEKARKILERDHYGIKDTKDRILEFLAVRKLKQDTQGSIICLVGPPGTGKTSVGMSIAKALNKKYFRFSVGGIRDESEIKGHRRTYIGSMPGQIIKGLKVTKTKNPVFVIDEIDKMSSSLQGDPASALLEVLDPEQNKTFRDHYLDIPFDISEILFIVTANTTENIPRPLLDRMECIELSGYTSDEKLCIGKKYLVPKSRAKHGLKASDIRYSDSVLHKIAEEYAREAGVRNFEKSLDRIHRKVAFEIVENSNAEDKISLPVKITEENVVKYLGQPLFHEDEVIKANKVGMSVGLAWTSMGGDTLAIEAQHIPGKGELKLTGSLGDVMQESANIAFSFIKSICHSHNIDVAWFEKNNIHLHVPEGATPKDGPSAGITMATAMYSLITGQVMKPDMAMTGELSLLGKVMPIGGLKEKILAAKRNYIKEIIIPKYNYRDLDKLDEKIKEGVSFHLVSDMEEVLSIAFPQDKFPFSETQVSQKTQELSPEDKLAQAMASAFEKVIGRKSK